MKQIQMISTTVSVSNEINYISPSVEQHVKRVVSSPFQTISPVNDYSDADFVIIIIYSKSWSELDKQFHSFAAICLSIIHQNPTAIVSPFVTKQSVIVSRLCSVLGIWIICMHLFVPMLLNYIQLDCANNNEHKGKYIRFLNFCILVFDSEMIM